jgi:predicted enzyme related to lactoylglutathione lyase
MGNAVVHFELNSKQPGRLSAFYEKAFGWKVQHIPQFDYRMVEAASERAIGGGILSPKYTGRWPGDTLLYIEVEDLAAAGRDVVGAGGKLLLQEQEVPGMGWFTLFEDPDARTMGLWKSKGAA